MDDDGSWENVTKGIKKLPKKRKARPPVARIILPSRSHRDIVVPGISNASPLRIGGREGSDKATMEKLKRGKFPIDGRLDLHGMTQREAESALKAFIEHAYAHGKRCVLIITGKGSRPDGSKGVIREALPEWLGNTDLRRYILAFRHAKMNDGGDGALYVLLKKHRI